MKLNKMHYYQHNIADYRKDTAHLSLLEHGIYRQLLDTYYLDEKPIETKSVIRRLSIITKEDQIALENVLSDFFVLSECGNFHHKKRCDEEILKYQAKIDTARANGSKGGRPKKPKITKGVNSGKPKITKGKANQEPLTNNQELINKEKPKKKFIAPNYQEVEAYAQSRQGIHLAKPFLDYFEAGDWKDAKGNQVKNWKQKFITWQSRDTSHPQQDYQAPAGRFEL